MNKDWLWKMQMDALESRAIGSDACRLLLLLCKRHHRNLCSRFPEPFKLSLADAAAMLGYSRTTRTAAVMELVTAKYMEKKGVTGCPPVNTYLISDWGHTAPINRGKSAPIKYSQPAPINSGQPTPSHISSSFQEEIEPNGSNSAQGGIKSSLRSQKRVGDSIALPPAAKYLTKSQIADGLHVLSQLRRDSERKTKTGAAFEKKT